MSIPIVKIVFCDRILYTWKKSMQRVVKKLIEKFNKQLSTHFSFKITLCDISNDAEGFPLYYQEAINRNIDINDYCEQVLKWIPARPIMESLVFPYINNNSITIGELGPGSGRWARHLVRNDHIKEIYLFDKSEWIILFLKRYFSEFQHVYPILNDGLRLPIKHNTFDIFICVGLFIELKLGQIFFYLNDLQPKLKDSGYIIFDYIDISTNNGWEYLLQQYKLLPSCYTYHHYVTIAKLLQVTGYNLVHMQQYGKSTYIIAQKNSDASFEKNIDFIIT